jgi:glycosyltransferase involved in cell wall biosynthesis
MTLLVVSATSPVEARGGERSLAILLAAAPDAFALRIGPGCDREIAVAPRSWRSFAFVKWVLTSSKVIRSVVRDVRPVAVHCNDLASFVAASVALAPHGIRPSLHVRGWPPSRVLWRLALGRARRVVCVSSDVAARVAQISPRSSAAVVPNPITNPNRWHRGETSDVVLVAGAITHTKGQLALVEQAGRALASRTLQVVFAGDDSDAVLAEKIQRAADARDLRVTFTGYRTDILDVMCDARLVVSASTEEGLPRVLMEACAMAVPVLAIDAPGVREVLGVLESFSLLDSLDGRCLGERLDGLADPVWRSSRRRRALELLEDWTPNECWRRFAEVLGLDLMQQASPDA